MLEKGQSFTDNNIEYRIKDIIGKGANTVAYLAERTGEGLTATCILKEYIPHDIDSFTSAEEKAKRYTRGKARFLAAAKMQNSIRQLSTLTNQASPVSRIFEANDTAYIEVVCYGGATLNKLTNLTLPEYTEIIRTIAKTVEYYHHAGYLCLDIKPENIFILQNTPDDTITQLVEFIDFDSIKEKNNLTAESVISYTRDWAAPEQHSPFNPAAISERTDIYTIGELAFYYLFGRHSADAEHRSFSAYPFEEVKKEYKKYTERPDIRSLFGELFRGTLRSSCANRFNSMQDVIRVLSKLVDELDRKDYVIPKFPPVSPFFLGREGELKSIKESLKDNHVLFVTGIGGIGKSALVRSYIHRSRSDYDVIVYLEYDGDIRHTFADDKQLSISTVSMSPNESPEEYHDRKLKSFNNICAEKRVLFVVDNYTGRLTKELSAIFDYGYDTIIITRNEPPKNSFTSIRVNALPDNTQLYNLISLNLDRPITKMEKDVFTEIIELVAGHTLTLELIARQIAAGKTSAENALQLIKENGFSRFSDEKISNYKDGEEVYGTLSAIISALFKTGNMPENARITLKVLAFLEVRGLDRDLVKDILKLDMDEIETLKKEGWLYVDSLIRVHPVIAETVQSWTWSDTDDITVMEYHKRVTDVYVGTGNAEQIRVILRNAKEYTAAHPRHIIKAMCYDIEGCYYDVLCNGYYTIYIDENTDPIDKMIEAIDKAIHELEQSNDNRKYKYLAKYYLDLASVLMRCVANCKEEVSDLLEKSSALIEEHEPEYSENRCYHNMITAWYFTLIEPDINKTLSYTDRAKEIAYKVFPTELEIIDIIYIPTANCLAEHGDMEGARKVLEEAVKLCMKYHSVVNYKKKHKEIVLYLKTF